MKHILLFLSFIFSVICFSCKSPTSTCPERSETQVVSKTIYDAVDEISPCTAKFSQTLTYNSGNNCLTNVEGAVALEFISNLPNEGVYITYSVQFYRDSSGWKYNDSAFLSPKDTFVVGSISTIPTRISAQSLTIQLTSKPAYYYYGP